MTFSMSLKAMTTTLLLSSSAVVDVVNAQDACGAFSIVAAPSLVPLATAWVNQYNIEQCVSQSASRAAITVEEGGSSDSIARACGTASGASTVDVAGMTRLPFPGEATTENGWYYVCERSTRSLIGIDVAVEGVSGVVSLGSTNEDGFFDESPAIACINRLGGLSTDQLRWIFSSLSDEELIADDWDASSVAFLDSDPATHLWSELDENCPSAEIIIAGPPVDSTAALLFSELIFGQTSAESFAVDRPGANFFADNDPDALSAFLETNGTAIAYFDTGYILTGLNTETLALVDVVDPENPEEAFHASAASLEDGSYPLSRVLQFNLFDDEESLAITRSFVEFIFSQSGDDIAKSQGNWPITETQKLIMATRAQTASGMPRDLIEAACGPAGGTISIAGSSTVRPVADLWAAIYSSFCDVEITVEGGGSSNGAGRVCGEESRGTPVDIGDMSREWADDEANVVDGYLYECLVGDTSRSAIQIDVAIDGLTVATSSSGDAFECIQILGGLTVDQLRWIYSSYNDQQLEESGWDPSSVPNSDRNSQTHKWNELNSECRNVEIRIAGPDDESGTYEYFLETILTDFDNGETFDVFRPGFSYFNSENDDELVDYIFTYSEAISFFGYSYYFENQNSLSAVAIRNDAGEYLTPDPITISDGTYNPLARRIYMNLLNDEATLANTAPFVKFGLENPEMVSSTGYVAIPEDQAAELINTRLIGVSTSGSTNNGAFKLSITTIVGMVLGSAAFLL